MSGIDIVEKLLCLSRGDEKKRARGDMAGYRDVVPGLLGFRSSRLDQTHRSHLRFQNLPSSKKLEAIF